MAVRSFPLSRWMVVILGVPLQVFTDDLPTKVDEYLVDIGSSTSRGLIIRGVSPGLGEGECTSTRHCTVFFKIGLVPHNDDGHIFIVFDAGDLLPQFREFVQRRHAGDGEYEQESLTLLHV